jgi:hypothetical protein
MSAPRPHPFTLVFGDMATEKFPPVRDALGGNLGLEHFLMTPGAVELLHELRPDGGLGDAVDDFVAFVHAAFCYWNAGEHTVRIDATVLRDIMANGEQRTANASGALAPSAERRSPFASYVQIAPRILWSQVESSEIHEPIDGWFAIPEGDALRVVACLGLHPERPGLSVLTATGPAPHALQRDDGTAPFAPVMEGGAAAGLHSVADADELLWLAWQSEKQVARNEK